MRPFVELPPLLIREIPRLPDRDARYIYEHLKYFCSRPSPYMLPAIDVEFLNGEFVVTTGHKFLRIAQELGLRAVRAVLGPTATQGALALSHLPPGGRVIPREELIAEADALVEYQYHVYFFEHALSDGAKELFDSRIAGFFERLQSPLLNQTVERVRSRAYPFEGRCAEFEALIPVGDRTWLSAYHDTVGRFSVLRSECVVKFRSS